jgi:biopolymer transport protein ExbD
VKRLSCIEGLRTPTDAAEEVIDIDVTPVMNMFVILIPFLVSVAVFTHLAVLEFSLPPNAGAGLDHSSANPVPKLTVVLAPDFLLVTQGDRRLDSLPSRENAYAFDTLAQRLARYRTEALIDSQAIVASRDSIRFQHVVRAMDACREAGFARVGLSSATREPERGE